ncbi:MAG: hypothetical protein AB1640_10570 [bacterium]
MHTRIQKLERILEIARRQRELLAREDLEEVGGLQTGRQQVLADIQIIDEPDDDEREILRQILETDREILWLLVSKSSDIQRRMQRITCLKKMLHAPCADPEGSRRRLSRRA